jgi:signal transduction histidine kinase
MDAGQMHQALMNLMTNAVEAVETNVGNVTVRAQFLPSTDRNKAASPVGIARISVIDNGPGIAPEMAAKVFEPFFTTKGLRGTGLGLAVAKRVAELHHGSVELKSVPGKGSTFTMVLPIDHEFGMDPSQTTSSRLMQAGWAQRLMVENPIDPKQL